MKAAKYFVTPLVFIALLLNTHYLNAQCKADWEWAKGIKGDGQDYNYAMAVDKWNNIIIGGKTNSSKLIIDSITMNAGNLNYLIKFNNNGKLLWAKKIGGAEIRGMVTDQYGNIYISGLIYANAGIFEQLTLIKSTNSQNNAFLVKYSPEGKVLWGKKAYISSTSGIVGMKQGVAIDTINGKVILSGSFSGNFIKTDNIEIIHSPTNISMDDGFFFVFDTTGTPKWGRSFYSKNGYVSADGVASDMNGNIYIGGYYVTNLQVDSIYRVGGSYPSMYIIKFNNQGKVKWIKDSSKGSIEVNNIQLDVYGNIIVCGNMHESYIKIENYIYNGLKGFAGMIIKIDSNGNIKWIKRIMGSYPSMTMPDGRQVVYSTANDAAGNIYAVGTYEKDSLFIDDHHFSKPGGSAWGNGPFYIKFDKNGNFKWNQIVSLTDTSFPSGSFLNQNDARIGLDRNGRVYVLNNWSYYTYDTTTGLEITFGQGIIVGKDTIVTPGGTNDIFIGKIHNDLGTAVRGNNISCHGANNGTAKLYIIGGTAPFNIKWNNSSTQQELKNLSPGLYKVTVTDANSCTFKDSIEITEPSQLYVSVTLRPDSAGLHKGEATAIVNGGTAPYTYLWNDASAQKTQKASGLGKGSYKVTVTDKNGCKTDTTITLKDVTGIDELFASNILVYPNPVFDGLLNIQIQQLPQDITLGLYDGIGREIIARKIQAGSSYHDQLSLPNKGIYILKVEMGGKMFSRNVVVQ
jgi:hypothetical protein